MSYRRYVAAHGAAAVTGVLIAAFLLAAIADHWLSAALLFTAAILMCSVAVGTLITPRRIDIPGVPEYCGTHRAPETQVGDVA